jgi:hypothetical protein
MDNFFNNIAQNKYCAMMYYNGTPCPWVLSKQSELEMLKINAEEMIKLGLKHGVSLKQQMSDYKGQMDIMEKRMYNSGKKSKTGFPEVGVLSEKDMSLWWLNMFALIRLKVVKEDNDNGLLVMSF